MCTHIREPCLRSMNLSEPSIRSSDATRILCQLALLVGRRSGVQGDMKSRPGMGGFCLAQRFVNGHPLESHLRLVSACFSHSPEELT